ncbi:MAG: Rid family detoxifying hydrolase [Candidatus Omnitrophota bacterium]
MPEKIIQKIECPDAPKAIGPYSQAVSAGSYVFVSGQIPLSADTGEICGKDIKAQASKAIDNMENILSSCGLTLGRVVRVDVFLTDMADFTEMNEVYQARFSGAVKPARCVVEVSRLPKNVKIELSCIAAK